MGRVIDALIAYRVLKLLVTPFNKTKAYKFGIIDDKGKVLIKSKDFLKTFSSQELPKAREAYTLLIRFVFNLKRLLSKVGIRGPITNSAAAAIAFFKEENGQNLEVEKTVNPVSRARLLIETRLLRSSSRIKTKFLISSFLK